MILGEFFMGFYIFATVIYAFKEHLYGAIPFLLLTVIGFFYIAFQSMLCTVPAKK